MSSTRSKYSAVKLQTMEEEICNNTNTIRMLESRIKHLENLLVSRGGPPSENECDDAMNFIKDIDCNDPEYGFILRIIKRSLELWHFDKSSQVKRNTFFKIALEKWQDIVSFTVSNDSHSIDTEKILSFAVVETQKLFPQ